MAGDIASLGFKIDTSDVAKADAALEGLAASGAKAESAAKGGGDSWSAAGKKVSGSNGAMSATSTAVKAANDALKAQQAELGKLLGKIDPVTAALDRLDDQQQQLVKFRKSGVVDADTFADYSAKISKARASLGGFAGDTETAAKSAGRFSAGTKESRENVLQLANALSEGNFRIAAHNIAELGVSAGTSAAGLLATLGPIVAVAAAAATLVIAYKQGAAESYAYNKALILTGNASGATAGGLTASAQAIGKVTGSVGAAAKVLTELAASGKIPAESFDAIAVAALKMEKATGTATAETVANFVKLAQDPVKASKDLNDQLNYLTTTVYAQIDALQRQGDSAGAAALAESAYADALVQRADKIKDNLGYVESAWNAVKEAASGAWDAILDVGREDTLDQKLSKLENRLKDLSNRAATPIVFDENPNVGQLGGGQDQVQKEIQQTLQAFQDQTEAARKAEFAVADNKAGIAAVESLNKSLDDTASKQDKLKKRYAEIDQLVKTASSQGKAYSQQQIDQLRKAAEEQYKETPARKVRTKATPAYQDDAATKLLQSLREQESSLEAQLSTTENLTAAQKARVQFEQQIADLKTKDILTADQKSLVANQDAIKAQLDKNVAIAEEVRLHQDSIKLQERAAQIQETIKSSSESIAEQRQRQLDAFGKGGKASERANSSASIYKEYQRYQDQLNKATPASQLGSAAYSVDVDQIKDGLSKALAANEDYYSKLDALQGNWKNGATAAFADFSDKAKDIAGQTYDIVSSTLETVSKGIGDSVADAIVQGKTLQESFSALATTILSEVISSLVQLGVRYGINAALEIGADTAVTTAKATNAAVVAGAQVTAIATTSAAAITASTAVAAAQVPAAEATTAAWAPAATVASIGSFGGAAAIGIAAVIAALALSKGFKKGGYTGNSGASEVAGVVHGQEYVFDAASTARIGKTNLDAMRRGTISGSAPAANYAAAAANAANASGSSGSSASSPPVNQHFYNTFPAITDSREAKKSTAQAARQAGRAIQNLQRYS